MEKLRLAVLFGGVSSEHEVSLLSVSTVLAHLDPEKYEIHRVGITKDGRWLLFEGDNARLRDGSWPDGCVGAALSPDRETRGLLVLRGGEVETRRLDAVLPVLHGKNGEDGTVQGLCALAGLPCVGCGVTASAVCMDKEMTHCVLEQNGIRTARWLSVLRGEERDLPSLGGRIEERGLAYPLFVKPARAGSSVGISKAHSPGELAGALAVAFQEDGKALIEETLVGQEVECAVMGNGSPVAAGCVGEIAPTRELYDYEGKYSDDTASLYIPAHIDPQTAQRVQSTALRAYKAAGCRGLARVDFFVLEGTGEVVLNEINTLPGFTSISMFPKLFCRDGLTMEQLLDRLIAFAME